MYKSNIYPKMILLVSFMVLGFTSVFAQTGLNLKLQLMAENTWGVYATPAPGVVIDSNTITGSGQVTIVMPTGYSWAGSVTSVSGLWSPTGGTVDAPIEDPARMYVSVGLVTAEPTHPIIYDEGTETLLFTFDGDGTCPDTMYLIDCGTPVETDPFCPNNSLNSNPGNDLSVIEFAAPIAYHNFYDNYAPSAWSCHDCDSDGILNAFEDTNGNGVFDVGVDSSDICDPCDPIHVETATLDFVDGFDAICGGDVIDTAYLVVDIEGGWSPYQVVISSSNGDPDTTVTDYVSGDTIKILPTASTVYTLTNVIDSFLCAIDPDSLFGGISIDVHGPISITADPIAVTECSEDGVTFSITAVNAGLDGTIFYKWQESQDNGATWYDLQDGSPYDNTDSTLMSIDPTAGLDDNCYRAKIWTEVCDTVYSAQACLDVEGPLSVGSDPSDFIVCDASVATFSATGVNPGDGVMLYMWQVSTDGGATWTDVNLAAPPGGASYATPTTTTLSINTTDVLMDGWMYRMAIYTNTCNRIFTDAALLDVEGPLTVTNHPDAVSNCAGGEVIFIAAFDNPGDGVATTYWEVSTDNGATWATVTNPVPPIYNGITGTHIGTSGIDTLSISNVQGLDSNLYRLQIETGTCSNLASNDALLDVSGEITFTQEPTSIDIQVCAGNDTIIVACATIPQGQFYYYWEFSTDNGATWDSLDIGGDPTYDHSSNGAPMSSGCDTLIIHDATGLQYHWYRAVAGATDCIDIPSTEARLLVEGPLTVGLDPVNDTICSGSPATFVADILNGGDTSVVVGYQWQYSLDNVTWFDLANDNIYGGVFTEELLISDVSGAHDTYYRLEATTSDCGLTYTASAQLTVEGPITVTDNPDDVVTCYDDAVSFTAAADVGTFGTFSQIWQVSSDGLNWTDLDVAHPQVISGVYTGATSTTLDITSVTGLYGLCYRLAFYTTECSRVFTDPGCLTIQGPLSIITQPRDTTECSEDPVIFTVDIQDLSLDILDESYVQYQWQESSDLGVSWTNLNNGLIGGNPSGDGVNGVSTDTLSVIQTASRDNHQFRVLIWSEFCDTLISNAASLFLEGPISFISEPTDTTECEGFGVSFTAVAVNAGVAPITYQWQISDDAGVSYTDISNGGIYTITGATTTTITYDTVGFDLNGDRIRLKAWTPYCDTIYSVYAQFDVQGEIYFTDMPDDVTACSGDPVCFIVAADNDGTGAIQYRWQYSIDGGSTYFNLINDSVTNGVSTNTMCISDIAGADSTLYRSAIWTTECDILYSDPALLVEEGPITFDDHPDDIIQCSAESVQFCASASILAGNSGVISYQWQASADGVSFNNIVDSATPSTGPGYVGTDTDCLTITNVAGLDEWHYRLSARTGVCSYEYSLDAMLIVEGPLNITLQPVDIQNCSDAEALFLSKMRNEADTFGVDNQYQWEILLPGSSTWETLTNGTTFNGVNTIAGANSDTLLITPLTDLNGAYVRMKGWTPTCDTLTTDSALIAVEGPLTFTNHPDDVTLCSTAPVQFTIGMDNLTGVGTVQYQWEYSVSGGPANNWVEIVSPTQIAGNTFSGFTTNQLSISNTAGMYNYKFRCKIRTGQCEWEFSELAQLFVEGPITIDPEPLDTTICSNLGHIIDTEISIPASSSGALNFQWQVSSDAGASWSNINDGDLTGTTNFYNGDETDEGRYFGTTSEDLTITLIEGLDGYMYRALIWTSTCTDTTYEMTLTVLDACSEGGCDFDLDGTINSDDDDDDNDQLDDYWEDYLTIANDTAGWNYLEIDENNVPFDAITPRYIYYSNCDSDSDNDGILDNQEDPDGDEINNGEETDMDGIFDGDPLDPCDPILGPTCIGIQLAIDVRLQGGKIGNSPTYPQPMRDDLRELSDFPVVEPYGEMKDTVNFPYTPSNPDTLFYHFGDGGDEEIDGGGTSILSISGQDAVIDWVFVELRSSTNLDSVITTRAALLQADGDVVDMDGVSDLSFINAPAGPYYVVVRHRNHLGIMTAEALDLSPIVSEVDFTDPATPTYGDYGQIEINSVNYLWGGDFNANDRVVYQGPFNDILTLFRDIINDQSGNSVVIANWILGGYVQSDINIDGAAIYQGPNNDRQLMLFNTTLSHPLNDGHIANFVIEGSLP